MDGRSFYFVCLLWWELAWLALSCDEQADHASRDSSLPLMPALLGQENQKNIGLAGAPSKPTPSDTLQISDAALEIAREETRKNLLPGTQMKHLTLTAWADINESLRSRWFLIYTLVFGGIVALLVSLSFAISVGAVQIPLGTVWGVFLNKLVPGHQGVVAHVSEQPELDWEELKTQDQVLLVALDGIEDPHNLGAILRTAWLMKAQGLFVPDARSVALTPAAMKVASGGAEHVPVQIESNLPSLLKSLKDIGFWIFGLSHKAGQDLWDVEYPEKVVWVIGSEGKGMRTPVERACDELVSIPQVSSSASYNASVAAGMALAEVQRQWQR